MKNVLANVVMLPTEKAMSNSPILLDKRNNKFVDKRNLCFDYVERQHLYFTTDEVFDPIKHMGMWTIYEGVLDQFTDIDQCWGSRKIIVASTDESLGLARPSNEFLKAYCEKGGIDQVLIEYNTYHIEQDLCDKDYKIVYQNDNLLHSREYKTSIVDISPRIKVAPDNTITIHPVKEKTYTRDEVIELFKQYQYQRAQEIIGNRDQIIPVDWIKNNL